MADHEFSEVEVAAMAARLADDVPVPLSTEGRRIIARWVLSEQRRIVQERDAWWGNALTEQGCRKCIPFVMENPQ